MKCVQESTKSSNEDRAISLPGKGCSFGNKGQSNDVNTVIEESQKHKPEDILIIEKMEIAEMPTPPQEERR